MSNPTFLLAAPQSVAGRCCLSASCRSSWWAPAAVLLTAAVVLLIACTLVFESSALGGFIPFIGFVRPLLPPQVNNLGELLFPEQFTGLHLVFVKGSGCWIEHEEGGQARWIRIGCRDKLLIEGLE